MIDLHAHILPGVDDGVRTEDDAVAFARVAWGDGVRTIVATPHCREGFFVNERPSVLDAVSRLRQRLARERIEVDLLPGAEVHLAPDLVERVRDGRATTLGDNGKTLLLELSLSQYPMRLDGLLFQLKLAGLQVVLAHPERIRYFQDDVKRYEELVRLGAWGQITTGSILGDFGRDAQQFSEELLRGAWSTCWRPTRTMSRVGRRCSPRRSKRSSPWSGRRGPRRWSGRFPRRCSRGASRRSPRWPRGRRAGARS